MMFLTGGCLMVAAVGDDDGLFEEGIPHDMAYRGGLVDCCAFC